MAVSGVMLLRHISARLAGAAGTRPARPRCAKALRGDDPPRSADAGPPRREGGLRTSGRLGTKYRAAWPAPDTDAPRGSPRGRAGSRWPSRRRSYRWAGDGPVRPAGRPAVPRRSARRATRVRLEAGGQPPGRSRGSPRSVAGRLAPPGPWGRDSSPCGSCGEAGSDGAKG